MSHWCDRSAIVLTGMVLLSMIMWNTARSTIMRCEEAKLKCAYRTGCGSALQHYITGCAPVLQGNDCSETCQHALIALTSTDEGKELMTIKTTCLQSDFVSERRSFWCQNMFGTGFGLNLQTKTWRQIPTLMRKQMGPYLAPTFGCIPNRCQMESKSCTRYRGQCECEDDLCLQSKQRVEICRSSVQMAMNRTRVSCRVATWICNADALCQTALSYYNRFCKSMFQGRKCTKRCKNSINILTRQEKAAKLNTCQCDGFEDYDCKGIHRNMNLLCFGKIHHGYRDVNIEDDRRNEFPRPNMTLRGDAVQILVDRRLFLLSLIIYYILKARQD